MLIGCQCKITSFLQTALLCAFHYNFTTLNCLYRLNDVAYDANVIKILFRVKVFITKTCSKNFFNV